jgi:hypothetical protein
MLHNENRGRCFREVLLFLGDRGHLDVHQVFERHLRDVSLRGDCDGGFDADDEACLSAPAAKISEPRDKKAPLRIARAYEAIARLVVNTFFSLNRESMFQTNLDAIA